jgi:hypothetical protein
MVEPRSQSHWWRSDSDSLSSKGPETPVWTLKSLSACSAISAWLGTSELCTLVLHSTGRSEETHR